MTARKKPSELKKVGRKSLFREEFKEQVYKLCLLGAIDKQIADFFGVSEVTINAWKKKYPTFLKSLKRGKLHADARVAEALFRRACGYTHPETRIFCYKGDIITHDTFKHYPPDTGACIFWLKNRAGWRDKQDQAMKVSEELISLLDIVDGTTKGKLPDPSEEYDAQE